MHDTLKSACADHNGECANYLMMSRNDCKPYHVDWYEYFVLILDLSTEMTTLDVYE